MKERREWVQALRPRDRIQLYAIAKYPGWQNMVQKVQIDIHYYEKAQMEDNGNSSAEELKALEKPKSGRSGGENSREDFISRRPKVVIYHQSLHSENGILTSLRSLAREETGITAVILGKLQLHFIHDGTDSQTHKNRDVNHAALYLNEYAVDDSSVEDVWVEVEYLQQANIKVLGMLTMRGNDNTWGDTAFMHSYQLLRELIVSKKFDGIDLDLDLLEDRTVIAEEKGASLEDVIRLIDSLHTDFGSDFIITATTCAEALLNSNSDQNQQGQGFQYRALELQRGELMSWYNVQIFSDSSPRPSDDQIGPTNPAPIFVDELSSFIRLLDDDLYSSHKILMAISTSPNSVGKNPGGDDATHARHGAYVELYLLHSLLQMLNWSYGPFDFGGVAGWEYSRSHTPTRAAGGSDRGGYDRPWEWVKFMRAILDDVFPENTTTTTT